MTTTDNNTKTFEETIKQQEMEIKRLKHNLQRSSEMFKKLGERINSVEMYKAGVAIGESVSNGWINLHNI